VDGELIQADAVVLALGPWTNTLASSLQLPHISGQLGHSLVLKPSTSEALPADCLFVSWQSKSGILAKKNSQCCRRPLYSGTLSRKDHLQHSLPLPWCKLLQAKLFS